MISTLSDHDAAFAVSLDQRFRPDAAVTAFDDDEVAVGGIDRHGQARKSTNGIVDQCLVLAGLRQHAWKPFILDGQTGQCRPL